MEDLLVCLKAREVGGPYRDNMPSASGRTQPYGTSDLGTSNRIFEDDREPLLSECILQ